MKNLQHISRSTFLRHNAIFLVGAVAMGGLNYIYYPVLARLMQPAAFGEVQALVSLFLQFGIFLTVLSLITVNIVANYKDAAARNRVLFELEKLAFGVSLILLLGTVVFGPAFQQFFRFASPLPFAILALSIVVTVPFTFRSAYLRGKKKFGVAMLAGVGGAAAKLALSALLVAVGLSTSGAMLGIVLAQLLAAIYAAAYAHKYGLDQLFSWQFFRPPDLRIILPELRYALLVLVSSLAITFMFSVDIVVVKHYFDAHTAGLYAGIATVARIIFFVTASIAQVLMPSVTLQAAPGQNRQFLTKSLILLAGLGGPLALLFYLAPTFIVEHLMGKAYAVNAELLGLLGLTMLVISIVNLLITYFVSLRRYFVAFVAIMGAGVTLALMLLFHGALVTIVLNILIGSLTMLCLLGMWVCVARIKQGGFREDAAKNFDHRSGSY